MKVLLITETLLHQLGCEKMDLHGIKHFILSSGGYRFRFIKDGLHWDFSYGGIGNHAVSHDVNNLDECFGFLADDAFRDGVEEGKRQVREALGIADPAR